MENLNEVEIKEVKRAVLQTWTAIGQDCEDCFNRHLTLAEQTEVILDASHMEAYGEIDDQLLARFRALPFEAQCQVVKNCAY